MTPAELQGRAVKTWWLRTGTPSAEAQNSITAADMRKHLDYKWVFSERLTPADTIVVAVLREQRAHEGGLQ